MVVVGLTVLDVPVPSPLDQVIVPPEQPLAVKVVEDPEVMENELALKEGAAGALHPPIC